MNRLLSYNLPVALFILLFAKSFGQPVTFSIQPGARVIGKEDVLQAEYKVKGSSNASNFTQPDFAGWKIVSGPDLSSQQISVNGKTESSASYIYSLQPKTSGTLRLPPATIEVDGKKMSCTPVSIQVKNTPHVAGVAAAPSNGLQPPAGFFREDITGEDEISKTSELKPGETAESKIRNNIFVKVFVNKTTSVIGEPVLVTYKLFTRINSEPKAFKQPAFFGCTVYEMTTEDQYPQMEKYNGKYYETRILRKVQLFPLQTGPLKLDAVSVDNEITLYKKNSTGYRDVITRNVTVSSDPVILHVNPLPEKNKPAVGNGTVGKFTIETSVEKMTDTADDNNNLVIHITGEGNFQSINCPSVQWPSNTEHFDNTENTEVNKLAFPASGTKTFTIPFLAKRAGRVIIPSIEFTYFDNTTHQYATVKSDSILITVLPPLKNNFDPSKMSPDITNHKYLWIIPLIALLTGLAWWWKEGRKKRQAPAEQTPAIPVQADGTKPSETKPAERITEAPIDEKTPPDTEISSNISTGTTPAEKLNELLTLEDDRQFYASSKQLATGLLQQERDETKKKELETIIRRCNEALYLPLADVNKEDIFKKLEELI
jgi:hypothetical protein